MSNELTILPPPIVPALTGQPIIVDELVTDGGTFGHYDLTQIRISTTNRKRFNELKLTELAASIKAKGVAQPILIRPVTPTADAPQIYEIVAGERRFRASIIAGAGTIPAMCRELSDLEALELQILENLQRDNPHPLEEAEGYERLMLTHGYSADQLVGKLNRSRSYIFGRLKLCALGSSVRELFLDDKFDASVALLIARLPTPAMQAQAVGEIITPQYGQPLSFRQARDLVRSRYMLDLKHAVFPIKDGNLIEDAGSCTNCPKRTGNQPEIYGDETNGNICTDPDCHAEKVAAHTRKTKALAQARGQTVIAGADAKKIMPASYGDLKGGYVDLNKDFYASSGQTTYTKLLGKNAPEATLLENPYRPGTWLKVAKLQDVETALALAGITGPESNQARNAKQRAHEKEMEAKAKVEREYRRQLFLAIRDTSANKAATWNEQQVAAMLYRQCPNNLVSLIDKLYGWDTEEFESNYASENWISGTTKVVNAIHQLDHATTTRLIRDLTFIGELEVNTYTGKGETPQLMIDAAALLGVDATAIRRQIKAEAKALADAKAAKIKKKDAKALQQKPAQAQLLPMGGVSINDLQTFQQLHDFISTKPQYLAELASHILDSEPHRLKELETAANQAGYVYGSAGWQKLNVPSATEGTASEEAAATAPPKDRPKLQLKPKVPAENNADSAGPVVKIKKNRSAAMAPAEPGSLPDAKDKDQ